MKTIDQLNHCCSECWHSNDKKCPDWLKCLQDGPLCHQNDACKTQRQQFWTQAKRQQLSKPIIYVGLGTCGLGAGAHKTHARICDYLKEKNSDAAVVVVGCIGLCSEEPIVDIQMPGFNRVSYARITAQKVDSLLDAAFQNQMPQSDLLGQYDLDYLKKYDAIPLLNDHPFLKLQTRCVLSNCGVIDPESIVDYIGRNGYRAFTETIRLRLPKECCDMVEKSGLRGRGGGGFPTGIKWKAAHHTSSDQKYIICNADEGDPGAFMDRAVIEGDPHRLLEGLLIGAYALGAQHAYVYIRAEYPLAIKRLKKAILEAHALGLLGNNILDSGFNLEIHIKEGAGAFVCGEETALMHSIEGKRGMPRPRPPFPVESGLFGKPTVINNVETLANIPLIFFNGVDWFTRMGTEKSKGTKVFALSGKVTRTGLIEIEMGKTMRSILVDIGGGVPNNKKLKAVQIGGPSGGCLTEAHFNIPIDYESLKQVGAMMGSGGLVVMDEDNCMVDVAKYFMEFIQKESCGKCIPCREGTRRMQEILTSLTQNRASEKGLDTLERFKGIIQLERLAQVIRDTSLCGLGQSAPNPVLTTLKWFRDEYEAHIYERKCPAHVCRALISYEINPARCRGCTLCIKKCPAKAIKGTAKSPHYIVKEQCISCGACISACPFHAIETH